MSFTSKDFQANTTLSFKTSSGDLITGQIVSVSEDFLELITSTSSAATRILLAISHIVYIEQEKIPVQIQPVVKP